MLEYCRDISVERKEILKSLGLNKSYKQVSSYSSKRRRCEQIDKCIEKLQERTSASIALLKYYTSYTLKKNDDIYHAIYEKFKVSFKKDFQTHINDFDKDYTRQTNEAFMNVIKNFSQRAHLDARKQILMKKNIIVDENGMRTFARACSTIIDDVKLLSGNSRDTNSTILDRAFNYINDIAPWNTNSLLMLHRDPIAAITVLLKTWWDSNMIGRLSKYNRSCYTLNDCQIASMAVADELQIDLNDRYFQFPLPPWIIAKGDGFSGMKKLPVENRRQGLLFGWSVILASNELSQSRHSAVVTLMSGLPSKSQLIVDNVQSQV